MPINQLPPSSNNLEPAIAALRAAWQDLSPVERAERVENTLQASGCSNRGLADRLGVDERSIRLCREVHRLSPEEKQEIRNGSSVASTLRAARQRRAQEELRRRRRQEAEDQSCSREIATLIRTWLRRELGRGYHRQVLDEVRHRLWKLLCEGGLEGKVISRFAPECVISRCRPVVKEDESPDIEHYVAWLLAWLIEMHPDFDILDEALRQVEQD